MHTIIFSVYISNVSLKDYFPKKQRLGIKKTFQAVDYI